MTDVQEKAKRLHEQALVINCLGAARSIKDMVEAMAVGGVSGINWTIAAPGIDFEVNDLAGVARMIADIRYQLSLGRHRARIVEKAADLVACQQEGEAGLILGFQDTLALEDRLELIGLYHQIGVRIVQLTYQRRNLVGDGCGEPVDAGLTTFGREVVKELNRLGILIDLSHVGPRTTEETIEASSAPCSFTHANSHAIYAHIRNKTDASIKQLAARGGVIGVDAISRFLKTDGHTNGTTVEDLIDHVGHVVQLVGVDHVGIGLDITEAMTIDDVKRRGEWVTAHLPEVSATGSLNFETYYPRGLRSMSGMHLVTEALVRRGFSDEDVMKILGGNFYRLFETVWG